jgi:hypothetical protein
MRPTSRKKERTMKKIFARFLVLSLSAATLIVLPACPEKQGGEVISTPAKKEFVDSVVTLADHNFQVCLRKALGRPTGEIMRSDLLDLKSLDASNQSITELSGIEAFPSLERLNLSSNYIRYLDALAGLTTLVELDLSHNYVIDVSPLAGLTNLKKLNLANNEVAYITPFSSLASLEELDLTSNLVSNLWALAGLYNLNRLNLTSNRVTNIEALKKNSDSGGLGPGSTVILTNNTIDNISLINYLPHLRANGVRLIY